MQEKNDHYSARIGNRTYKALECLWLNSKEMQNAHFIRRFRVDDAVAHAKEFGTVKMATARQSGHSTAIANFLVKHNKMSWLVLAENQNIVERIAQITSKIITDNPKIDSSTKITKRNIQFKNGAFINFDSINAIDNIRGMELDGVIVDCASFISKTKIEELYRTALPSMRLKPYVFFIFVQ